MRDDLAEIQGRCHPSFMIVGTPRSGTTLVQRLIAEHPNCSVPPETHFFVHFYPRLLEMGIRFPVDRHMLPSLFEHFKSLPTSKGLRFESERVLESLPFTDWTPLMLFGAVVRALGSDTEVIGEKTPDHLLWWKPIERADPAMRFVWVVRDPRAVVSSAMKVPWGMSQVDLLARRWLLDAGVLAAARTSLDPTRITVIPFEHVIADPAAQQDRLWQFLELPPTTVRQSVGQAMISRADETWKSHATESVESARHSAWRHELSEHDQALIERICSPEMSRLGYGSIHLDGSRIPMSRRPKHLYMSGRRSLKNLWISRQQLG